MIEFLHALPPLKARPVVSHKGTFGRVLVVGGSPTMLGAPVLAGTSALRAGSGLVQVAVHESLLAGALGITPELVGLSLSTSKVSGLQLLAAGKAADAIVIGPGMGIEPAAARRLASLLKLPQPKVIDADAINVLAAKPSYIRSLKGPMVITPHPLELSRLCAGMKIRVDMKSISIDDEARSAVALVVARRVEGVVLLKGHRTVVVDAAGPNPRQYTNKTGDSSLAKAGTGDVLAGLIGCLLGQAMSTFDAACMAAWLHGRAGEIARALMGPRHVLARDVITALPAAFADYEKRFGLGAA